MRIGLTVWLWLVVALTAAVDREELALLREGVAVAAQAEAYQRQEIAAYERVAEQQAFGDYLAAKKQWDGLLKRAEALEDAGDSEAAAEVYEELDGVRETVFKAPTTFRMAESFDIAGERRKLAELVAEREAALAALGVAPGHCELHPEQALQLQPVPAAFGTPGFGDYGSDYERRLAERERFANATAYLHNGCVVDDRSGLKTPIRVCGRCVENRQEWQRRYEENWEPGDPRQEIRRARADQRLGWWLAARYEAAAATPAGKMLLAKQAQLDALKDQTQPSVELLTPPEADDGLSGIAIDFEDLGGSSSPESRRLRHEIAPLRAEVGHDWHVSAMHNLSLHGERAEALLKQLGLPPRACEVHVDEVLRTGWIQVVYGARTAAEIEKAERLAAKRAGFPNATRPVYVGVRPAERALTQFQALVCPACDRALAAALAELP